jgi:hypothetical protein
VCQRWRCYWCADAMGALSKPGVRCAPPQTWCVVLATLWWPARHMQAQRAMASRQRGARLVYWHDWASTLSGARRRGHATTTEKLWHASRGFSPRHHVWERPMLCRGQTTAQGQHRRRHWYCGDKRLVHTAVGSFWMSAGNEGGLRRGSPVSPGELWRGFGSAWEESVLMRDSRSGIIGCHYRHIQQGG